MILLEIILVICAVVIAIVIDGRIGDERVRPTPLMWTPPTLYDFEAEELAE